MLQQTRVETVIPYYHRFLETFPTLQELAAASEDQVLALWSGLGYYRRAKSLRTGARHVLEVFDGAVPRDPEQLQTIPGVGRYTAGAIASIAYDTEVPVLDGNVRRVLSRITAGRIKGTGRGADEAESWRLAGQLATGQSPGDLNQALMELGATVCTPAAPACERCPVAKRCDGLLSGDPEAFPVKVARPAIAKIELAVGVILRNRKVLLVRSEPGNALRGKWDLPAVPLGALNHEPVAILTTCLQKRYYLLIRPGEESCNLTHSIMNHTYRLRVHTCTLLRGKVATHPDLQWVELDRMDAMPVSGATWKVLIAMGLASRPVRTTARP
jgi:A/G-specific adenine glycosylase